MKNRVRDILKDLLKKHKIKRQLLAVRLIIDSFNNDMLVLHVCRSDDAKVVYVFENATDKEIMYTVNKMDKLNMVEV